MPTEAVIIGAGPAGIAAAIQLKRVGLSALVFEKAAPGGLLRNANRVENYPGFPDGISGPALVKRMTQHLRRLDVEIVAEQVTSLDYRDQLFTLETARRQVHAPYVIVASGTQPRQPGSPVIPPEAQAHVFYEVFPLRRARGRRIAIVGAGDAAFDYALNLSRANQVVLLNRGNAVKCLPLLQARARLSPRITYRDNSPLLRIERNPNGGLSLTCRRENGEETIFADDLIFAIGRLPQLDFLSNGLRGAAEQLAAEQRLFLVGDVANGLYRQAAIAAGDGLRAAMTLCQNVEVE